MGSWGYRALESDEGLEVIDSIRELSETNSRLNLLSIITTFQSSGSLNSNLDDIDFYYDITALALTELFFQFKERGRLDFDELRNIESFSSDRESLELLLHHLQDIQNEKPDQDGSREIVDLKKESKYWEEWKEYVISLIQGLQDELRGKRCQDITT